MLEKTASRPSRLITLFLSLVANHFGYLAITNQPDAAFFQLPKHQFRL